MTMKKIYLDDERTPKDEGWIVVRNYKEFVNTINKLGLENIDLISFDHDLGDTAKDEYYNNVKTNYELDYDNIVEKTGYDCAKFLVDKFYLENPDRERSERFEKLGTEIKFPTITVHSANPIGAANIMGYINNFLKNEGQPESCVRVQIPHFVKG